MIKLIAVSVMLAALASYLTACECATQFGFCS